MGISVFSAGKNEHFSLDTLLGKSYFFSITKVAWQWIESYFVLCQFVKKVTYFRM